MTPETAPEMSSSSTPPVPWLTEYDTPGNPGQTWSHPFDPERLLCVRYTYSYTGYVRCQHTILRRNSLRFLGTTLLLNGAIFIGLLGLRGIITATRGGFHPPTPGAMGLFASGILLATVLLAGASILLQAIINPIAGCIFSLLPKKERDFICGVQGKTGTPSLHNPYNTFTWKQIQKIVQEEEGDIIFLPKNLFVNFQYVPHIPREAFPDTDAATRFYTAVTALHQSGGNPEAVPESSLIEFAP